MTNLDTPPTLFSVGNKGKAIISSIPYAKTVSIGILIKCGSINEEDSEWGYSHFLEHMIFKGTKQRDYVTLNKDFEKLGAYINAFTDKYFTMFYVHVLPEFVLKAFSLLMDIVFNSILPQEEIEKERNVILEEIDSYNDSPEDLIIESFYEQTFRGSFLAHPILGTKETLNGVNREKLLSYYKKHYSIDNAIISVAGNVAVSDIKDFLQQYTFNSNQPPLIKEPSLFPIFNITDFSQTKAIEQSHIALAFKAYNIKDPSRYALKVWNMILGEMTSSRLYLDIREKKALCYSIESSIYQDPYTGMVLICGATHPKNTQDLVDSIITELSTMVTKALPTNEELEIAKNQIRSKLAFRQEGSSNVMMKRAIDFYYYNDIIKEEDLWRIFTEISLGDLEKVSKDLIHHNTPFSLVTLMPEKNKQTITLPPIKF